MSTEKSAQCESRDFTKDYSPRHSLSVAVRHYCKEVGGQSGYIWTFFFFWLGKTCAEQQKTTANHKQQTSQGNYFLCFSMHKKIMGWVRAVGDDLILVELKWWETFSSLYLGQERNGTKNRELTAQRKKHSSPQCSPEGSRWSLFHSPSSSCSPNLGNHSSCCPVPPWDGDWCQSRSLSLSQGSLTSCSTLLALPDQRNLQMTAYATNFWRPFTSSLNLGEAKIYPKLYPSHAGSLPFRFWEKIPSLQNTAWFLVEQDNLIHYLISSDTKWSFMGAWSHQQQWEKV